MLLAGDIGGTKTAVGIFSEETGPHTPLAETEVHSGDYPSLEAIARVRKLRICLGSSTRHRLQRS